MGLLRLQFLTPQKKVISADPTHLQEPVRIKESEEEVQRPGRSKLLIARGLRHKRIDRRRGIGVTSKVIKITE